MRLEPLGNGVMIYVNDIHHFTTDTILLADFAGVKKHERVVDLGTGCGTIPLLLVREEPPESIIALDLQQDAIALLYDSIRYNRDNGVNRVDCITPMIGDIRAVRDLMPAGEADVVICNPPYKLSGAGITNPDNGKRTARHEVACSLEDICSAAKRLLRSGGRFVVCQRPERLTDILITLRAYDLEPKRLRMVQGRAGKAPKLVLIESKRGARPGFLEVSPTLVIEDEGGFTREMRDIYGSYKDGYDHE